MLHNSSCCCEHCHRALHSKYSCTCGALRPTKLLLYNYTEYASIFLVASSPSSSSCLRYLFTTQLSPSWSTWGHRALCEGGRTLLLMITPICSVPNVSVLDARARVLSLVVVRGGGFAGRPRLCRRCVPSVVSLHEAHRRLAMCAVCCRELLAATATLVYFGVCALYVMIKNMITAYSTRKYRHTTTLVAHCTSTLSTLAHTPHTHEHADKRKKQGGNQNTHSTTSLQVHAKTQLPHRRTHEIKSISPTTACVVGRSCVSVRALAEKGNCD